jgi:hypothetical protein
MKDQADRIIIPGAPVKRFTQSRFRGPAEKGISKFLFDTREADLIAFPRIGVLGNFNAF